MEIGYFGKEKYGIKYIKKLSDLKIRYDTSQLI
jgi:DNA-dependent RNA polymerase auxiliary subunit epsilon